MSDIKVIDGHINLASELYIPKKYIQDTAENIYHRISCYEKNAPKKETIVNLTLSQYKDHDGELLLAEMDNCNIASAILLVPDFSVTEKLETPFEEVVERHLAIADKYENRFKIIIGVDPRNSIKVFEQFKHYAKEPNVCGMKLYPPSGYSPSDPALDKYYDVCSNENLVVSSHTGPGWNKLSFAYGNPMLVDEATRKYKNISFILGHGGVHNSEVCIQFAMYRENVYLDISGFAATNHPEGWQQQLNGLFRSGVNHKIIYGTSWPASKMQVPMKTIVESFLTGDVIFEGISKKEKKMILSQNIERILR